MDLALAKVNLITRRTGTKISAWLIKLSLTCLGIAIVFLPWRFALGVERRQLPPVYSGYTDIKLYVAELPLLLTIVLWLLSLALRPRQIKIGPGAFGTALAGFVLVSLLSSFSSVDLPVTLAYSARLLLYLLLYLYLINEMHNFAWLWLPAAVSILVQSGIAFGQAFTQHSIGLQVLQEPILNPESHSVSIVMAGGMRMLRVYGLTDHPNILGGCLVFSLLLVLIGYLESGQVKRWLMGVVFVLGSAALLLTFSRSAWLGLAAGMGLLGVYLAITHRRQAFRAWLGLLGATLLLLSPIIWKEAPFLSSRLNLDGSFSSATPENQSINERWLLLAQAEKVIAIHPITGVGMGAYPQAFHAIVPDYPFDYQPPHVVLAEVAAETGLPGAFLYMLVLLAPWFLLFHYRKALKSSIQLAGMTGLILAASVISFLDYYLWLSNAGSAWQWLIWGLWGSTAMGVFRGLNTA